MLDKKARKHIYYLAHKDIALARAKAWHLANPEKARASSIAWQKRNIEKVRIYRRKASAKFLKNNEAYRSYASMMQRCYNPKRASYPYYGGRGITVCERWRGKPNAFLQDMGKRPIGTSLDRIDNDGNYTVENCRWATQKAQCNNRRARCS